MTGATFEIAAVEPGRLLVFRLRRVAHGRPPVRYSHIVLEVSEISKSFPAVRALDGVGFKVGAGEIVGVIGENGAGKSTLMKILAGIQPADTGTLRLDGEAYAPRNVNEATRAGVVMIHQELNLVDDLTVAENIVLGREPRRAGVVLKGRTVRRARELLKEIGADINPRKRLGDLPVAQQQLVEIAKALSQDARVLILDEPTAVLSDRESRLLFALEGCSSSPAIRPKRLSRRHWYSVDDATPASPASVCSRPRRFGDSRRELLVS